MELMDRIKWPEVVDYWKERFLCCCCHDELECRELWGEEVTTDCMHEWETEAEEMERRISLYEDGHLEEAIEGLEMDSFANFMYFDGVSYDWEKLQFGLWDMIREEYDQQKRKELREIDRLIDSYKYEEAYQLLDKDFMKLYTL